MELRSRDHMQQHTVGFVVLLLLLLLFLSGIHGLISDFQGM